MSVETNQPPALAVVDSLAVDVLTDNVSDTYVSKTTFAVSEFANVVLAGATGDLGRDAAGRQPGLRPAAALEDRRARAHAAVRHRHRRRDLHPQLPQPRARPRHGRGDRHHPRPLGPHGRAAGGDRRHRRAARPRRGDGARQSRHVQRARRAPEERHHLPRRPRADAGPDGGARRQGRQRRQGAPAARRPLLLQRRDPARQLLRDRPRGPSLPARTTRRNGGPTPT